MASFEGIAIPVDGVIVDANQRLAELLGYDHVEDVLGPRTMEVCGAPEDLPDVRRRLRDRVAGEYVITAIRKDGSRFRAELASTQGQLGDHSVRIAPVRDVTERERIAAQVRASEVGLRGLVEPAFDLFVFSRAGTALAVAGALTGSPEPS